MTWFGSRFLVVSGEAGGLGPVPLWFEEPGLGCIGRSWEKQNGDSEWLHAPQSVVCADLTPAEETEGKAWGGRAVLCDVASGRGHRSAIGCAKPTPCSGCRAGCHMELCLCSSMICMGGESINEKHRPANLLFISC